VVRVAAWQLRKRWGSAAFALRKEPGLPQSTSMAQQVSTVDCAPPPGLSIEAELGTGTFGTVYRAVLEDGRAVAAKRFVRGDADVCGAEKSGKREARMLRRIQSHRLVCGLVSQATTDNALWLTTELGGPSLASLTWLKVEGEYTRVCGQSSRTYRVDRGHFWHELFEDEKDVTQPVAHKKLRVLLVRLLEAVEHLASNGIVHADIKPDNILMDGAVPRLCDFGSAYEFAVGDPGGSATPEYRAPECVTHPQTLRTAPPASVDVYAVGAVFLELACGFPVWFPFNSRVCDPPGRPTYRCKPGRWLRGALAVPNREGKKVAKRQGEVVRDLCSVLRRMPGKGLSRDTDAVDLLERLLDVDPASRASPAAARALPFLAGH
jgi:serine/threonine protein kinase